MVWVWAARLATACAAFISLWPAIVFPLTTGSAPKTDSRARLAALHRTLDEMKDEITKNRDLAQDIVYWFDHPLELNTATTADLARLPFVTPNLAGSIVKWRTEQGPFREVAGLASVPGIDPTALTGLSFSTYVAPQAVISKGKVRFPSPAWAQIRSRLKTRRVEEKGSDSNTSYARGENDIWTEVADSASVYNRVRGELGEVVSWSILQEQDRGEAAFCDYLNGYVATTWLAHGGFRQILLGGFFLDRGQGLVVSGPYGHVSSTDDIGRMVRTSRGVRGYTGSVENAAFRGAALEWERERFSASMFASRRHLDAHLNEDGTVRSLPDDGRHVTASERNAKDTLREDAFGTGLDWAPTDGLLIGLTVQGTWYDRSLENPDWERGRFDLRGNHNVVSGLALQARMGEIQLFGEGAQSEGGGYGAVGGALIRREGYEFIYAARYYSRDFHSPASRGLSATSGPLQNEWGHLCALTARRSAWRLDVSCDLFGAPWRTYQDLMPTHAGKFSIRIRGEVGAFTLEIRQRVGIRDQLRSLAEPAYRGRYNSRLRVLARKSPWLRGELALEYVTVNYDREDLRPSRGAMALLGGDVTLGRSGVLRARAVIFDTDYWSRIYVYDPVPVGAWGVSSLIGKGWRLSLLQRWHLLKGWSLSIDLGLTDRQYREQERLETTGTLQLDVKLGS